MNNTVTITEPTQSISTINGIDIKRQLRTIDTIGKSLSAGKIQLRATNHWQGGSHTRSRITDFVAAGRHHKHAKNFTVVNDLPGVLLGSDLGPAPTEYALQALAACMTATMIYNCAARGIEVRSVKSEVQGKMDAAGFLQIDENVRNGFSRVGIKFDIDADASVEELKQLLDASPLLDVFKNGVPVSIDLGEVQSDTYSPSSFAVK